MGKDEPPTIPKAVITVAGMIVFVLLALSIAKLVDYCYDRHAISDDASDISDYTREILKGQLMLAFSKTSNKDKNTKLTTEEVTRKFVKVWRAKVARNKVRRLKKEISMAEERGTFRPGSSHPRGGRTTRTPSSITIVHEKPPLRPVSARRKLSSVAPAADVTDSRKGASRPISSGLKSRPVSAKSFKFVPRAGKR